MCSTPNTPAGSPAARAPRDGVGAARHVGGVLEQRDVAGHQRRRQEAEHLPDREIPRHHANTQPIGS
jgi:hypothetical protein